MRINVMKKDERFLDMNNNKIFLQNWKGEIRVVRLIEDDGIRLDTEELLIGYGNGTVEYGDIDESIEVTNF